MKQNDKKVILEIYNSVLSKYSIPKRFNITEDDIIIENQLVTLKEKQHFIRPEQSINSGNHSTKISNYFDSKSKNKINDKTDFYHILDIEYAITLLEKKEIQLTAIPYYFGKDPFEYIAYMYLDFNPNIKLKKIDQSADYYFIFCLTESIKKQKLWNPKNNEKKIAIKLNFEFNWQIKTILPIFQLRNVVYIDNKLDFIKELQIRLKRELNMTFNIKDELILARYFKNSLYKSEKEIRLCFDYQRYIDENKRGKELEEVSNQLGYSYKKIEILNDNKRNYIKMPLNNEYFNLNITQIICSNKIKEEDSYRIERIASNNNIPMEKL